MIMESHAHSRTHGQTRTGRLLLNAVEVGAVRLRGQDGSWTFADFIPGPGFVEFAPIFGRWSLLMHADGAGERLSEAASDELRAAEYVIDSLHATLLLDSPPERHSIRELNIDGPIAEWKE